MGDNCLLAEGLVGVSQQAVLRDEALRTIANPTITITTTAVVVEEVEFSMVVVGVECSMFRRTPFPMCQKLLETPPHRRNNNNNIK